MFKIKEWIMHMRLNTKSYSLPGPIIGPAQAFDTITFSSNTDSGEPVQLRRLARAFAARMRKV